jgi:hypothetical protein
VKRTIRDIKVTTPRSKEDGWRLRKPDLEEVKKEGLTFGSVRGSLLSPARTHTRTRGSPTLGGSSEASTGTEQPWERTFSMG